MKHIPFCLLAAAFGLCVAPSAGAVSTVILEVYQDAYIEDFTSDENELPDGVPDRVIDSGELFAGKGPFVGPVGPGNVDSRLVFTFDLRPYVGSKVTIANVSWQMARLNARTTTFYPFNIYLSAGDGIVSLEDFSAPAVAMTDRPIEIGGNSRWGISIFHAELMQPLLDDPTTRFVEFRIEADSYPFYIAPEAFGGTPELGLIFAPVPEPASGLLMLIGGTLLPFYRRSRAGA